MKYRLNDNFFGIGMENKLIPYKKVINNGISIETQDYALLEALCKNESDRTTEVIDWHLFKEGYSVLIDDDYNIYGCMVKTDGYVQLNKLKLNHIQSTKDYKILVDDLTVQQLAYIERALQKYTDGEIILNDNRDADGNINFEDDGCLCSHVIYRVKITERIKYGEDEYDFDERCHDCGAKLEEYHHYGCDVER